MLLLIYKLQVPRSLLVNGSNMVLLLYLCLVYSGVGFGSISDQFWQIIPQAMLKYLQRFPINHPLLSAQVKFSIKWKSLFTLKEKKPFPLHTENVAFVLTSKSHTHRQTYVQVIQGTAAILQYNDNGPTIVNNNTLNNIFKAFLLKYFVLSNSICDILKKSMKIKFKFGYPRQEMMIKCLS